MIESQQIRMNYGDKEILQPFSFQLPEQQLVAFIGPNGAGKSTYLSILSRLKKATAGEVYLDKTELKSWKSKELAKKLAILKQSNSIQLAISVRDLVSFGRFPYSSGKLTAADEQFVDEALQSMNLLELQHEPIDSLSGGQLQRAYIAMILAQDTDYILLDEPLNNLDLNHANQMMHLLKKLVTERQKTVVIVLHDINFAASYADYVLAMRDGEIVAKGTTADVMTEGILTDLYQMPIRICEIEGKRFCLYYQ